MERQNQRFCKKMKGVHENLGVQNEHIDEKKISIIWAVSREFGFDGPLYIP